MSHSRAVSHKVRRRNFCLGGASALAAPFISRRSLARSGGELVFVSWGGSYHNAVRKGLVEPFMAETGIHVTMVDTPDLAKVKAQILSGNVEWDIFDSPGPLAATGSREGYWEALDTTHFPLSELSVQPTHDLAPFCLTAGGIAYDPREFPDGRHPRTFAEYFDTKRFPGLRTLRNRVSETLEVALLADGVPPDQLYPLDVERGFRMLDTIKPSIIKWVEATTQTITMLEAGEADFSYSYASRVQAAQASGGVSIDFSFAQTLNFLEYLSILKGAPHRDEAMQFVAFALRADRQAATMDMLVNRPVNEKAMGMLSERVQRWMPDINPGRNALVNDAWWAQNYSGLERRFKEWTLS
ncbi:ABC transporter substrate-binding protein [Komagataeibacter sp. NFXK3]